MTLHPRARTCALATAIAFAIPFAALAQSAAPIKIAANKSIDLRLDGRVSAQAARPMEIRTADAAFIKVHFEHFSLPAGVTLEVSNPSRTEVYRYSSAARDRHTVAADLGQDGRTRFSAMSVTGPVALLRLVGTAREPWTAKHGVVVSRYLEGFPEAALPELQQHNLLSAPGAQPMSICGVKDSRAAACYSSSDTLAFDRTRPVARMLSSSGSLCTAWRVGASNHMFTNNHCVATASAVAGAEFWFNYQKSSCTGADATPTKVAGDVMFRTDATLDYTLFSVKNFSTIQSFGHFGIETRAPITNETIFIPGHPGGRSKELSVVSDQDGGGSCRVNVASTSGNGSNTDAGYYCDTEGGSSGSPVVARSSRNVIALHHLGGCLNKGAKMSLIWPQVSTYFGGTVPVGDNGTPPPPPPPPGGFFENTTDYAINDNATIDSPVTVSGRTGNAPSTLKVNVTIYHTYKGDLKVDLVAPDGTLYNVHNRAGGSADNIIATFTVNASSEVANGTWRLRVNDNANADTGRIDKWSLQF